MSHDSVINLYAAFMHRMFSLKSTVASYLLADPSAPPESPPSPASHHHFACKMQRQPPPPPPPPPIPPSSYGRCVGTTLWHDHKLWWETKWTTCCDCTVGRTCFISELLSQLLSLAQSEGFSRWQGWMTGITRAALTGPHVLTSTHGFIPRRTPYIFKAALLLPSA